MVVTRDLDMNRDASFASCIRPRFITKAEQMANYTHTKSKLQPINSMPDMFPDTVFLSCRQIPNCPKPNSMYYAVFACYLFNILPQEDSP